MISPTTIGELVATAVTLPAAANIDELIVTPSAGSL
jgi:NADP-dependent 3-hydroxy acid dehydrogenase YdfG